MSSLIKGLVPIVDCDSIVYRCGLADKTQTEPLEHTLYSVKQTLNGILDNFERKDEAQIYIQGGGNYRNLVATIQQYKGNRDPSKRPIYFDEIRTYLMEYHGAVLVNRMETDDAVGICITRDRDNTCAVHIDKDIDTVAGNHFHFGKSLFYQVSEEDADFFFWTQVLTGDSGDNIRGLPKVGPKTAQKILQPHYGSWVDLHNRAKQEYINRGYETDFHETATLLFIQREPWINYDGSRLDGKKESCEESSISAEESITT